MTRYDTPFHAASFIHYYRKQDNSRPKNNEM